MCSTGRTASSRAPTPSVTSCPTARRGSVPSLLEGWIGALDRDPARLRARRRARHLRRSPATRSRRSSASSRRSATRSARWSRRRRRGDRRVDEQPLVPALGELGAARRDRPDARGRDRPAGRARRDLRDLARSSTPSGRVHARDRVVRADRAPGHGDHDDAATTLYVRFGDWIVVASRCSRSPAASASAASAAPAPAP